MQNPFYTVSTCCESRFTFLRLVFLRETFISIIVFDFGGLEKERLSRNAVHLEAWSDFPIGAPRGRERRRKAARGSLG